MPIAIHFTCHEERHALPLAKSNLQEFRIGCQGSPRSRKDISILGENFTRLGGFWYWYVRSIQKFFLVYLDYS